MNPIIGYAARSVAAIALIAACTPFPPADVGVAMFAWNRTSGSYTIKVGPAVSYRCYVLGPSAIGKFASLSGPSGSGAMAPALLFRDGRKVGALQPSFSNALFIVTAGDSVEEVSLEYKYPADAEREAIDLPQYPEIDGQPSPGYLPETTENCVTG